MEIHIKNKEIRRDQLSFFATEALVAYQIVFAYKTRFLHPCGMKSLPSEFLSSLPESLADWLDTAVLKIEIHGTF